MNLKRAPGWGRVLTLGCQGAIVHCSVQKNPTNSNPLLPLLPFTESQQSRADSGNFSTTLGLHRTQPPEPPSHLASTLYPPPTSACPFPAASALWPWPFSRPQLPHESNVEAGGGGASNIPPAEIFKDVPSLVGFPLPPSLSLGEQYRVSSTLRKKETVVEGGGLHSSLLGGSQAQEKLP